MKIQNLLESRFKPILAYHATSGKHLRSIIKNGLIPNKSEGGWGSKDLSDYGTNNRAMAGVYFTKDVRIAQSITSDVVNSDHEPRLIVVCSVQERSAEADEDITTAIFGVSTVYAKADYYIHHNFDMLENPPDIHMLEYIIPEVEEEILNKKNKWIDEIFEKHQELQPIRNKIMPAILDMYRATIRHSIISNYLQDETQLINKTENRLRDSIDKVNRVVKKLVHIKNQETFKINKVIGFSGADKIVGLIITNYGYAWGVIPPELQDKAKRVYNTPMEMLKNFEKLDI